MSSGTEASPADAETKGIIVTHGSMCFGMVDAVQSIAGAPAEALIALSNDGRGPEDLVSAVMVISGDSPTIIFADLQTGSCALAARFACSDLMGRRVVFGANLPMLLDFVFHRHLQMDALVARLIDRGRSAIQSSEPYVRDRGNRPFPSG